MNKQFDQMTVAHLAAMLADAKKADGTPVFSDAVREPCPGSDALLISGRWVEGVYIHDPYCHCRGLGYVPSMSLEVWMGAIITLDKLRDHHGTLPSIEFDWNENTEKPFCTITCGHGPEYEAEGTLVLEALLRALVAWLEAQGIKLEVKRERQGGKA